ncbi:MAG: secretin N-terminal domain-containing protein [Burkholderiales bacterium]|nr:secretin N-terminal domain-containing protein [Burkholderiales bacterium]
MLLVAGCAGYAPPKFPVSDQHLSQERVAPEAGAGDDAPAPVTRPSLPPPKPPVKLPTYSVVVTDVPVKELLFALARDTRQNIDVHPGLQGLVSLNAIDETLPSILDRVARQTNLRWKQEGRTIHVVPDAPFVKTYRVNYVNAVRETESTVAVTGQIATVTQGGAGGGGGGTGGGGAGGNSNSSSTTVTTRSKNDFWEVLEKNVRAILAATRSQTLSSDERAARGEALRAQREERIAQAEAVARAGANAKDLFASAFDNQAPLALPGDITNEVAVNAVAGTVTVMASEKQHLLVQEYLDNVLATASRQVLIEATIAEVELSRQYQAGVDWQRIATAGAGLTLQSSMTATNLVNPPNFVLGYATSNQPGGITGTLKLLEQFGTTRVLSSPKVMAINNQTALLKVVRNVVYFQIQQQVSQAGIGGGTNVTATTTTARTVPIGLIMALTPQINENGTVTLTVRPTVTSQVGQAIDPNPVLTTVQNLVPIVEIREIESVLQLQSGQTAVLGGLIKDEIRRERDQVPGLGNLRGVGDAFAYRNDQALKTELVIFLRPVVVKSPSIDSDELRFLRAKLPRPADFEVPSGTGAAWPPYPGDAVAK